MPATRKHLHISKPRRRQRSVSLTTRASRCGVKNYVNVLKSVHPSVETFFPVTKQYLQEYIDAKKKQGTIKANSLDQYFQHIESYNMALGHGWDSQEFEPMMRDVLEELVQSEERSGNQRKTTTSTGDDDDELFSQDGANGIFIYTFFFIYTIHTIHTIHTIYTIYIFFYLHIFIYTFSFSILFFRFFFFIQFLFFSSKKR
ncbi:hypothetical protein GLOIN_2v475988 [Rhizophagus irregularis DAOM 181602=DAOM 197198]|uniref:Uncharacterized protein n=1 Tax=Rhizophagus irregularis (strain DAOM 181602 / DAOM 197198 / MUCL 43194) TaxID=747089 RepID=A0A2P4QPG6_RHIID|nr:hypothetical protein GLOIN_2v475988 [Rhizophagus irregularis DAOM 181602=DAOM 197198]POG79526.1 hypothetical protein GLOIN_2v475988 [Rhizophagus irregularis DAOM 181602=DAOM 197198]|eukprot:XP_025186392.1 hypothetical protein GLOIN_2v475988 [Rhizophagus irregularis DAOM 181602=DAOM 197198]